MRKAVAAFALLLVPIAAVGAPPTVPRKYVGDWVAQTSACDAPLRLRVGSSAVTLIDGTQSQKYTWHLVDVPSWARRAEFKNVQGIGAPVPGHVILQKTSNGWRAGVAL